MVNSQKTKDRVTHYEVWNEPDLLSFWRCQPKAEEYVDLVRLTSAPLREEQPDAKINGGAIACVMTVWSIKFLEDCMRAGLNELIDIVSYHGYKRIPERHSAQEVAAFTHVLRKYARGIEHWQGEGGIQSHVPEGAKGIALSTMKNSESIQARMLLRRFLLELHNGFGMTRWFHMADFVGGIMTGFWLVSYIMLWLLVIVGGLILIALARDVEVLHKQVDSLRHYLAKTNENS